MPIFVANSNSAHSAGHDRPEVHPLVQVPSVNARGAGTSRLDRGLGLAVAFVVFSLGNALRAAPVERDLGEGLVYFRAHQLPADLPPTAAKPHPLVLDLRFSAAADSAASAFGAWLNVHAAPQTPVLILVNGETPHRLLSIIAENKNHPGLVTIGSASKEFVPDIVIKFPDDVERKAYDALEHGASIESLITENPDKPRADEAAIAHERANPPDDAPDSVLDEAPVEDAKPAPPAAPPIIDSTLESAVHLHRALLALKKI